MYECEAEINFDRFVIILIYTDQDWRYFNYNLNVVKIQNAY